MLVSRLTDLAPRTSRPSSVKVPVLSKHITSTVPATLTLLGLIQKISFFRNRERANEVPIVNVAGNAGGTIIVIKSSARTIIKCQCIYMSDPTRSNTNNQRKKEQCKTEPQERDVTKEREK